MFGLLLYFCNVSVCEYNLVLEKILFSNGKEKEIFFIFYSLTWSACICLKEKKIFLTKTVDSNRYDFA